MLSGIMCKIQSKQEILSSSTKIQAIKFTYASQLIAGGDYFFFRTKRGDYSSKAIISNIVHRNSCPKYVVLFIFPLNQKIITSNTLSMGFLRVPKLVPWLVFRA